MKKIYSFLSVFVFLSFTINAQYAFKVLAAKGSNQVLLNSSWTNIKPGTKINSDQTLKVVKGGYLGLIHSSGKTFEIEKSGEFPIHKLESQVKEGKAGFGEKYADFVADGMFAANENASKSYDRTGSVVRGGKVVKTPIVVYAQKEIRALKDKPLELEWNNCGDGSYTYVITFKNLFNEILFTDTVSNNSYLVDFNNKEFHQENDEESTEFINTFLFEITAIGKDGNSVPKYSTNLDKEGQTILSNYSIKIENKESATDIKNKIDPIEKSMDKTSAVDYLILAMAYEKEGLMAYAVQNYSKAHSLSKNVDAYQIQHDEYIKYKFDWKNTKGSLDE